MTRRARWGQVVFCTALVYATLPVGNAAWSAFRGWAGPPGDRIAAAVILLGTLAVVVRNRQRVHQVGAAGALALATVVAAWIVGLSSPDLTPAEKTHFVTYGFLAWVVVRALDLEGDSPRRYLLAALIVGLIGWGDEGIQYLLPRRHFEWKDVGLNLVAAVLALLAVAALRGELRRDGPPPATPSGAAGR